MQLAEVQLLGSFPAVGPGILIAPNAANVQLAGTTLNATVVASGAGPLTYQWSRNGTAISGATEKVRDRFDDGVAFAQENLGRFSEALPGKEDLSNMQSSLTILLGRQPLVLGAVGLAIGAAVAGAFQVSDVENVWVGNLSDKVKSDMSDRAGAVTQSLREASDILKAEFSDTGAEVVDRVKQAGKDAADAAQERLNLR